MNDRFSARMRCPSTLCAQRPRCGIIVTAPIALNLRLPVPARPTPTYPSHLVQRLTLRDGTVVTIRPIRPEDADIEQAFVRGLSPQSRYFRFMETVRELSPRMLEHLTRIDYDLHMALIAVTEKDGAEIEIGVARYVIEADRSRCEFAIVISDGWQRRGLGTALLRALMDTARAAGIPTMYGDVLSGNAGMLRLVSKLGFSAQPSEWDPGMTRVSAGLRHR
jgi:acetyltransferase